jgi:uncharacterized membrane protein
MKEFLDHLAERVGMVSLLVGTLFVVIALISLRFPPKKINDFYGYRTPRSMNSQAAWDFSQKYSSVIMLWLGFLLLLVSSLNSFINISQEQSCFLGMCLMILGCATLFILTERAIKKNFPNEK